MTWCEVRRPGQVHKKQCDNTLVAQCDAMLRMSSGLFLQFPTAVNLVWPCPASHVDVTSRTIFCSPKRPLSRAAEQELVWISPR